MNFFVIGLPRSRTAWMANFLSQQRLCYHEGLDGCYSMADYRKKLGINNGDSSTALMLLEMNHLFPSEPKLIIRSDKQKAIDYGNKTFGFYDPAYIDYLEDRLEQIIGWHISIDEIDFKLKKIWEYLIGDGFDKERAKELIKLRIEMKNPLALDQCAMKHFFTHPIGF